jgi:hypothetical protein
MQPPGRTDLCLRASRASMTRSKPIFLQIRGSGSMCGRQTISCASRPDRYVYPLHLFTRASAASLSSSIEFFFPVRGRDSREALPRLGAAMRGGWPAETAPRRRCAVRRCCDAGGTPPVVGETDQSNADTDPRTVRLFSIQKRCCGCGCDPWGLRMS